MELLIRGILYVDKRQFSTIILLSDWKIRRVNTAHVQLEYIANKPKGKSGTGDQEEF